MRTGTRIRLSLESRENKGRSRSTALHSIPGPSGLPPPRELPLKAGRVLSLLVPRGGWAIG